MCFALVLLFFARILAIIVLSCGARCGRVLALFFVLTNKIAKSINLLPVLHSFLWKAKETEKKKKKFSLKNFIVELTLYTTN